MILITWRNARTGYLFAFDARSILQGVKKKPDISHIEKKYHVCIPHGFLVKKANVQFSSVAQLCYIHIILWFSVL